MNLYHNRIIVKVGTSTLTNEMGQSNFRSFDRLACVIADIQNMGYEVILVSSGAIAVGTNKMSLKNRPSSIRHATEQGIDTIITNGKNPSSLYGIVNGESIGTLFTGG